MKMMVMKMNAKQQHQQWHKRKKHSHCVWIHVWQALQHTQALKTVLIFRAQYTRWPELLYTWKLKVGFISATYSNDARFVRVTKTLLLVFLLCHLIHDISVCVCAREFFLVHSIITLNVCARSRAETINITACIDKFTFRKRTRERERTKTLRASSFVLCCFMVF